MDSKLYLDTARVGRMTTGAQRACEKAVELAQSDPQLIYQAMVDPQGSSTIPFWTGFNGLASLVMDHIGCSQSRKLIASSNSASLMKLAARCLFLVSRRPLVTDLIWPNHLDALNLEQQRTCNELRIARVRRRIRLQGLCSNKIADLIVKEFLEQKCDALFLTAVSNDGIRLPVSRIVESIERVGRLRFVVVDGAQEFAHCDTRQQNAVGDLYLFGAHKWLGAYHPLSLGIYGKRRSSEFVERTLQRLIATREISDPLLKFLFSFHNRQIKEPNETVNFIPLISTSGALADISGDSNSFPIRLANANRFFQLADGTGWEIAGNHSHPNFQTGIVVLQNSKYETTPASVIESSFSKHGIILTAYSNGRIRASMPSEFFSNEQEQLITSALQNLTKA